MKLRIGVLCYPSVGGSGILATELGMKLADRGHDVHFITSSIPFRLNAYHPNITFHQVEINQYSVFRYPPYDITLASKIASVIQAFGLDVIHAHYAVPHAVCAALGREMAGTNIPIVSTLHGTDITVLGEDEELKPAILYGLRQSNAITAVSDSLRQETLERIGSDLSIDVIHNFIDESVYRPLDDSSLRERYGLTESDHVVIHVSNFRQVKRIDLVLEAFDRMDVPDKKLLLVGDGPLMGAMRRQVSELSLEQDVIFAGKQEQVAELLAISDVHVLLSDKEAFGLVALEAMATGIPSVVSDAGGLPEVITDGAEGFVVARGDVAGATKALENILLDKALQMRLRENGLKRAKQFASADIVSAYESLYERVVRV
ncbi:MAG: N-acetyl-alpha-D-glucosaminyl L-malate synthase BshA [Exiguobacterium sp.]|uniref:N-acetyl-alpha-D-glucosaminyl L-malate synthase BshA n=1 Tax=Exiguobacterium alkaliphilum TaxID=1428684 RepID=A0ABT2KSL7_9BACL|nr:MULTISPECIES: N-acetyl-alpha-D-glucosaminyl L-malate synthase BshA [Exiguobacterium]MDX5324564.1 N-acetyl-alpha-D-glucosaminyl L-malate synthase BshA [Exiguobacterium sp.]MCT4793937.1 N-acetyl-alpha-D-glucosaminyl L-malate synthase BshA [Exiguobacterium alkaliphilum]MDX5426408.1 N-acetyl-alpha-D-glucosaminyl L-malate synthase BshA [Exiguobacterium sp.]MDX6773784.1 N-acetyl-alpha-D-glucosaminyl L-malate synthase BshA [Exiguobacterium sp.]QUE85562.1 N-acetyl-alpha-D-glucosaminyl L-malate synt